MRLLVIALACAILVPVTGSASTAKKSEKVVKKKHRAKRHIHDYGFLPGYVPPAGDEVFAPSATMQRHTVYSYSYGGGYWYPAAHWYGYGGPRFYRGRWNGGAFGPCWTTTPIGPMWNCGK